ncbi:MAG: 30S ribosomal protein S12 methylthiotransferase RimO [Holophagales bacterium]|nr:30S ribosomal protein S12 methylthiotransferase RimO [Holophagales bacterium]MYH25854.1 30S ribosomal protein S12 methylthiotransferase RimO [Holophagales bacterium]
MSTPARRVEAGPPADVAGHRVGLVSLGCAKNHVDSEVMLGVLGSQGFELVADLDRADTVIVNTCGFIDEAREESIDAILDAAARKADGAGPVRQVLVAGCMANRYGRELATEIPEIDGFVDLDSLRQVGALVQLGGAPAPEPAASHLVFDHRDSRLLTTGGYAYLKVAEGCNNPCTFCAIPVWRGRLRSRPVESLVHEARDLVERGARELVLVAQDTTRYGEDLGYGRHGLLRLVEALLAETDADWIRFLYAYPTTLDESLLRLMASEPRVASYLDMPLQHSDREVLRAMRRGGSADRYRRIFERARELDPEMSLRTTFIVGFPGEDEAAFERLLGFVSEVRFDHLGAFVYSPENDTPSASLPDQVPRRIAEERKARLLELQRCIALERRGRLVGRTLPMLIEGPCEETEHLLQARHQGLAPEVDGRILINDVAGDGEATPGLAAFTSGRIVDVEITDAFADDSVGRIVGFDAAASTAGSATAEAGS